MSDVLRLLAGTVVLRPYVFAFLAVYLVAASAHTGVRRTLLYIPTGYFVAWCSEFASIHWGFPYGDYFYIPHTIDRELWVFGVPFMDSLSYVSYCAYSLAVFLLSPVRFAPGDVFVLETRAVRRSTATLILGAFLFVLLDIIIDPVALLGNRWFLGEIYGYKQVGLYFGIPMSNFWGWLVVGVAMVFTIQLMDRIPDAETRRGKSFRTVPFLRMLGPVLYVSILIFNLSVTFWIGANLLGAVGCMVIFFPVLLCIFFSLYKHTQTTPEHLEQYLRDFPEQTNRCRRLRLPVKEPQSPVGADTVA